MDDRAEIFPEKEEVLEVFNKTAQYIQNMNLADNSVWWNKANFFTISVELAKDDGLMNQAPTEAAEKLVAFERAMPTEYSLAAREAVNGKAQREFRGEALRRILLT